MARHPLTLLGALLLAAVIHVPAAAPACPGDCDGGGTVTVDELILAVRIGLGEAMPEACPAVDRDGDGAVVVAELIAAVRAALDGCPAATPTPAPTATPRPTVRASFCGEDAAAVEARIQALLERMTLAEKVEQMHGAGILPVGGLWPTTENSRLGIPPLRMVDGPRGVSRGTGPATSFPVGIARGASWDEELEERVGRAIALEARARGATALLAPTVNVLRHPLWGRAQETYGEDPFHIGRMGAAFVRGAQTELAACAKHFALNSIENSRAVVDVVADERTLREVYLPHFRTIVQDAHVAVVMSAYNSVNGSFASENGHLLRQILKTEWGFPGLVVSDWVFAVKSTVGSARAGLDLEMPLAQYYGPPLLAAVERGEVDEATIDEAVLRILRVKECFPRSPDPPPLEIIESDEHRALAREAAVRGMVLLKNDGLLPLDPAQIPEVVVVGPLADRENLGDTGSSATRSTEVVTPLEGLRARFGAEKVRFLPGPDWSAAETESIRTAAVVIAVAGLTWRDEGENVPGGAGDRSQLELPDDQESLVAAAVALNPRTVVVVEGGGPVTPGPWLDRAAALLLAWYPGLEGGHAIADVLTGQEEPGGRLPVSIARELSDLPPFDNVSRQVQYGYFHGYRHLDREGIDPLFPFGFGLSYTTFAYEQLQIDQPQVAPGEPLTGRVRVRNTGPRRGREVVQIYASVPDSVVERPVRWLVAFAPVELEPGESRDVAFRVDPDTLAYYDTEVEQWVLEETEYVLHAGSHARDLPLEARFRIGSPAGGSTHHGGGGAVTRASRRGSSG